MIFTFKQTIMLYGTSYSIQKADKHFSMPCFNTQNAFRCKDHSFCVKEIAYISNVNVSAWGHAESMKKVAQHVCIKNHGKLSEAIFRLLRMLRRFSSNIQLIFLVIRPSSFSKDLLRLKWIHYINTPHKGSKMLLKE